MGNYDGEPLESVFFFFFPKNQRWGSGIGNYWRCSYVFLPKLLARRFGRPFGPRAHSCAPSWGYYLKGSPSGYISRGGSAIGHHNSHTALACPRAQALGRPCGPSSPERRFLCRTCGYLGGTASATQGRAAREEVLATTQPTFICMTPMHFRSSAPARLVVIP